MIDDRMSYWQVETSSEPPLEMMMGDLLDRHA